MVGLPDFRSYLKPRSFATQPLFQLFKIPTSWDFRTPLWLKKLDLICLEVWIGFVNLEVKHNRINVADELEGLDLIRVASNMSIFVKIGSSPSVSIKSYPPASEASREVANLTEKKNPLTPLI